MGEIHIGGFLQGDSRHCQPPPALLPCYPVPDPPHTLCADLIWQHARRCQILTPLLTHACAVVIAVCCVAALHATNNHQLAHNRFVQKQARDDWILVTLMGWLTSAPSMPYAMCLFFLLAGYFSPGSVNRKGALRHVWDRVIRLLIPVIVYAVVINPLIYTVNKAAGIPADNPSELAVVRDMSYAETWAFCLKRFNIAPGPTW